MKSLFAISRSLMLLICLSGTFAVVIPRDLLKVHDTTELWPIGNPTTLSREQSDQNLTSANSDQSTKDVIKARRLPIVPRVNEGRRPAIQSPQGAAIDWIQTDESLRYRFAWPGNLHETFLKVTMGRWWKRKYSNTIRYDGQVYKDKSFTADLTVDRGKDPRVPKSSGFIVEIETYQVSRSLRAYCDQLHSSWDRFDEPGIDRKKLLGRFRRYRGAVIGFAHTEDFVNATRRDSDLQGTSSSTHEQGAVGLFATEVCPDFFSYIAFPRPSRNGPDLGGGLRELRSYVVSYKLQSEQTN